MKTNIQNALDALRQISKDNGIRLEDQLHENGGMPYRTVELHVLPGLRFGANRDGMITHSLTQSAHARRIIDTAYPHFKTLIADIANGVVLTEYRLGRFSKYDISFAQFQLEIARINSGL